MNKYPKDGTDLWLRNCSGAVVLDPNRIVNPGGVINYPKGARVNMEEKMKLTVKARRSASMGPVLFTSLIT